jgi:hypothetical protein
MLVSQMASGSKCAAILDDRLRSILDRWQPFLLLGSVGPDLPAIMDAVTFQHVSDLLHDGKPEPRVPTNTTACELYSALKGGAANRAEFAFLLGYVSHTVADVIVHPIVNDISGGDSIQHRNCETCQDALLFHDCMKRDIKTTDYLSWLTRCKTRPNDLDATIELWQSIVERYYGDYDCGNWVTSYETGFSIARQAYHIDGWSYPSLANITSAEVNRFYSHLTLPVTKTDGRFKDQVFDKAVAFTAQLWQQIYLRFVAGNDQIADLVPDWNMNTGENMTTGQPLDLWR